MSRICNTLLVKCRCCDSWFCPPCDGERCHLCGAVVCCWEMQAGQAICRSCSYQDCSVCGISGHPRGSEFGGGNFVEPCLECGALLCHHCGFQQDGRWLCDKCCRERLNTAEPGDEDERMGVCDLCNERGIRDGAFFEMKTHPKQVIETCHCGKQVCPKHSHPFRGAIWCCECYNDYKESLGDDKDIEELKFDAEKMNYSQRRVVREGQGNGDEQHFCYLCARRGIQMPAYDICGCGGDICEYHREIVPTGGRTSAWMCTICYETTWQPLFSTGKPRKYVTPRRKEYGMMNQVIGEWYRSDLEAEAEDDSPPSDNEPLPPSDDYDDDYGFCALCQSWQKEKIPKDELKCCPSCGGCFCDFHFREGFCLDCWDDRQRRRCQNIIADDNQDEQAGDHQEVQAEDEAEGDEVEDVYYDQHQDRESDQHEDRWFDGPFYDREDWAAINRGNSEGLEAIELDYDGDDTDFDWEGEIDYDYQAWDGDGDWD